MNGVTRRLRLLIDVRLLIAGALILFVAGCQTTQPHVTAKVIFQQDDLAAEVSSEWR